MADRLMERDWRFIIDSLLDINMTSTVDALVSETLDLLEFLINADQITFSLIEQTDNHNVRVHDMMSRGVPATYKEKFLKDQFYDDPYFYGWSFFKETTTFRDTDMMPDDFRTKSTMFKEIYEPQGIYYALRSHLVYKQQAVGNISIFNSKERGDFSERDVYILSMIGPHISFKMGQLLEKLEAKADEAGIDEAVERFGFTAREREIVDYLLEGIPDAALADKLYISPSTLKKHIYNIYKKADVNSRVQLFKMLSGQPTD